MLNLLTSPALGFFCLAGLFVLCFLTVVGAKIVYITVKQFIRPKKEEPEKTPVKEKRKPPVKRIAKPIRSIEINPDEVDKIYMRKSSNT